MARADTPQVTHGTLRLPGGDAIALDSAAWQAWLAAPASTSFRYAGAAGSYTARRERQRNGWYWYAYRRIGGRLRKLYLGRGDDITAARLDAVAAELSVPPPAPAAAAARLPAPGLLVTKLHPPPPRDGLVARPRLIRRLTEGLRLPLTIIVAPPGFGKTTLAADALRAAGGLRWAWLSLDAGDNDPARFWSYIAAALDGAAPGLLAPALPALQSPQSGEAALAPLLNALAAAPGELALALDDFHLIEEPAIHGLLAAAAEQLPPHVHLVMLSRADPPLPLARMRARGRLHEIRIADLRFTADEASAFLSEAMGLAIAPHAVAELERRTEGWAAGLQLAALAMRDRGDSGRFIESFAGSHRAVADYLAEEVIDRQPDDVQRFLLASSVLERMCGGLCDALIDVWDAAPAAPGIGQSMIERLERASLFIIPLDDERRWYRYHHLFGEMLRDRLLRRHPELPRALHRRAAEWHRAAGNMPEAIDHALSGEDYPLAAEVVEAVVGSVLWLLNHARTTIRWLDRFPPEFLRTRPLLLLARVWVMLAQVRIDAVEQALRQLENDPSHEAAVRGHIAATRSFVYRLSGDIPAAVAAAHHALDDLPDDDINVRSLVANNLENCYMVLGDVRRAEELVRGMDDAGMPPHSFHQLNLTLGRAGMARARGQLIDAIAYTEQALRAMQESERAELPSTGLIHVILAELHYERNDLEAAERHAVTAISLGDRWWNNDVLLNASGVLGQIRLAQGSPDADRLFGEMERLLKQYNVPGIVRELEAGKARSALLAGRLDEARRWAERSGLTALDDPPPVLGYHYSVLARALAADGQAHAALLLLARLLQQAEAGEYVERQIELHKLRALAHGALGESDAARAALVRALALARPGGYIRTFLDEGQPMERLLAMLASGGDLDPQLRAYAADLLATFAPQTAGALAPPDPDALTRRELEVLRGLAAGLANKQIAYQLRVEVSTVRSHVKAIYAKLGASGRVQAVALARARGLLSG